MNEDRIKLAEAMGWTSAGTPDGEVLWSEPPAKYPESYCFETCEIPDPFTDANDDYAVLEWMREKCGVEPDFMWAKDQAMWNEFSSDCIGEFAYQIGDYARAALKVIE